MGLNPAVILLSLSVWGVVGICGTYHRFASDNFTDFVLQTFCIARNIMKK